MGVVSGGGGGGGGYTPPTARATYADTTNGGQGTSVPNTGVYTALSWAKTTGTALLSLSSPAAPTIITAGIYAISGYLFCGDGAQASGGAIATLELDSAGPDLFVSSYGTLVTGATLAGPIIGLSAVCYLPAGAAIAAAVQQDGPGSLHFSSALIVQRVT